MPSINNPSEKARQSLLTWMATGDNRKRSILRRVAILLLTDAVASEVENKSDDPESPDFRFLWKKLFAPGREMTDTFMSAVQDLGVDIEPELLACEIRGIEIIESINANLTDFSFANMWRISPNDALSEIMRALGHGVSFWDNHRLSAFGFDELPKIGNFEGCCDEAYTALVKIVEYTRNQ